MRYALTKNTRAATGLQRDDRLPVHSQCEMALEHLRDDLWFCPECAKPGRLLLDPTQPTPTRPTVADEMRSRWREVPTPAMFPEPPEDTSEWQEYFDRCFPAGLLLMSAHDDAQHTLQEDTSVTLAARVHVADEWPDRADLVVTDILIDRPRHLTGVVKVERVAAGALALGNAQKQWVRLDGHLRVEEKRAVVARREGGYFGMYSPTSRDERGRPS